MPLRLPRLDDTFAIVAAQTGKATREFARYWEAICAAIDARLKVDGSSPMTGPLVLAQYEFADLPTVEEGALIYVTDGRKAGEGAGSGTGVMAFGDGTNWIACDTGAAVAA